jgi:hypothetical protein
MVFADSKRRSMNNTFNRRLWIIFPLIKIPGRNVASTGRLEKSLFQEVSERGRLFSLSTKHYIDYDISIENYRLKAWISAIPYRSLFRAILFQTQGSGTM